MARKGATRKQHRRHKRARKTTRRTRGGGIMDSFKRMFSSSSSSVPVATPVPVKEQPEEGQLARVILREMQERVGLSFQEALELHTKAMMQSTGAQVRVQTLLGFVPSQGFDEAYRNKLEIVYGIYQQHGAADYVPALRAAVTTYNQSMEKAADDYGYAKGPGPRPTVLPLIAL